MNNQEIKADAGKLRLTLVPLQIIREIAKVRMFGIQKYKEKESWKSVEEGRYRDAMFRHMLLYLEDPYGLDEESGLPHLAHLCCNAAFLCELQKDKYKENKLDLSEFSMVKPTKVKKKNTIDLDGFDWSKGDFVSDSFKEYVKKIVEKENK